MIPGSDPLCNAATAEPETIALIDRRRNHQLSYAELDPRVDRLAAGLRETGVEPGDIVAVEASLHEAFVESVHAIRRCGGAVAPIDPQLPEERARERLELLEPAVTILVGSSGEWTHLPGSVDVGEIREQGSDVETPNNGHQTQPDDLAAVMFTSGTTGRANAVRVTAGNLTSSAIASAFRLGMHPDDRWLCCLPPHSMGGFAPIIRAVTYGTGIVLQPFEPARVAAAISATNATGISVVPVMLRRAIESEAGLDALRAVLVGGAPTPPRLVERALERDIGIYVSYGLTETSSQVSTATPKQLAEEPSTVGHPLRWTRVSIVDEDGNELSHGEEGELVVDGPTVTPGYLNESSNRRELTASGGLRTGDLGHADDDGLLYVTGRLDDRIISGGVTVDPAVIERELQSHQAVEATGAIGLPDEEWGERVGAVIEVAQPDAIDHTELADRLSDSLPPAERPREIVVVEELPRTASGTIDRERLRALFETAEQA